MFGVLLLLDNLDLVEASRLTCATSSPACCSGSALSVLSSGVSWGWLWLLAGGWTLLDVLDIVDLNFWQLFFPVALDRRRLACSFTRGVPRPSDRGRRDGSRSSAGSDRDTVANAFAFMSGNERKNDSERSAVATSSPSWAA